MTYGIDIAGAEIRWVRLNPANTSPSDKSACGRIALEANASGQSIKQALRTFFSSKRVKRFVFPLYGQGVRARCFPSDKVDISELEDNVSWEAKFMLAYDKHRDVLSFDPLRSVANQTWVAAAAAPLETIRAQTELFPNSPAYTDTALTALANAVLESKWGQKDVKILHLDRNRGFVVVVSHGNPILTQEIPNVKLTDIKLDKDALSLWQDELKLRRNFLPQDKRGLDHFLLSGEAATVAENAVALGKRIDLAGEVFNPFEGTQIEYEPEEAALYTLAYACALRGQG